MPHIHILEPHPSTPHHSTKTHHYLSSGIGGAGNIHTYLPSLFTHGLEATGPAFATSSNPSRPLLLPPTSLASTSTSTTSAHPTQYQRVRMTGRGGAGNARRTAVHAPFDLEADLKLSEQRALQREERRRMSSIAPSEFGGGARRKSSASARSVCHVGRGGAGNAVDADVEEERERERRRGSFSTAGSGSTRSGSVVSVGWGRRVSRLLGRE